MKLGITLFAWLFVFQLQAQEKKIIHWLQKAESYNAQQQLQKANDCYMKVIELDSTITGVYLNMGSNFHALANYQQAINCYNKGIAIDSSESGFYNNRANSYLKLNEFEKAINDNQTAVRLTKKWTDTLAFNIGNIYWKWGKLDSALTYYNRSIAINPVKTNAYTNKSFVYLEMGDFIHAKEAILTALNIEPQSYSNLNNLGYIYFKLGDIEQAINYIERSKSINPQNAWVYRNLGLIYQSKQQKEKACANLKKAIELGFITYWGEKDLQELLTYCK